MQNAVSFGKRKTAKLFNSLRTYLDFTTEMILFLSPENLERKMGKILQLSVFEKQNKNSKNQTTNHTFSFKIGDRQILLILSYNRYLCEYDRKK